MAGTTTAPQRLPEGSHANWKCFPAPYVMPTDQQRIDSRNRKRSRNQNLSYSSDSTPRQWPEEPVQRPVTVHSTLPQTLAHTVRLVRSKSKLQKRPSHPALKKSTNNSAMPHSASPSQGSIKALPQLPDESVMERGSPLRRKPVAARSDRPRSNQGPSEEQKPTPPPHRILPTRPKRSTADNNTRVDSDSDQSSSSGSSRGPTNPTRTPRHHPVASNDPSPLNPAHHIPSSSFTDGGNNESAYLASDRSSHVLLPAGFKPGRTEHTYVEEIMMPAVTHEVIKHNRTEIIQEEITRDIHVHHYYTYTQPIKMVEILPARHFVIDAATGAKIEIPAPEGWIMPSNLQPHKPDMSGLAVATRHYLVDEQHPAGIAEAAPSNMELPASEPELAKKSSTSSKWSAFPKVR